MNMTEKEKKIKFEFIKKMLSSESGVSSKRFNGTIGYILAVIVSLVISIVDVYKDGILSEISRGLIDTIIWSAVLLLGATAVEKLWTSK